MYLFQLGHWYLLYVNINDITKASFRCYIIEVTGISCMSMALNDNKDSWRQLWRSHRIFFSRRDGLAAEQREAEAWATPEEDWGGEEKDGDGDGEAARKGWPTGFSQSGDQRGKWD